MSKGVVNKLVPELRFPEFKNNENWEVHFLYNLAELKGRIGYRGYTIADIVKRGNGAITLSPSNFNDNCYLNFEKSTYITWDKYDESPEIQLEEGQTVLVKTASVGKSAYVQNLPEKTTINPQIVVLKPKNIFNRFLAFTISHNNVQNQIKNCVGAGAIPNLSQESISKFKILTPPDREFNEQRKIANCLSSLDELISAHIEKLEVLKGYKKGLMQQLFPARGKKNPELRFEEFKDSGEWLVEPLSKIYSFITTNSLPRDNLNYEEGGVKNIHYGDIHTKFSALFDITKEKVPFINSSFSLEKTRVENYCKEGDIIFADASEDLKDIGKMIELVNLNNEKLLSGLHTLHARQVGSKLAIGFAGHLFISNSIRRQIQREAQGSKVLSISVPRISNISITYPKDKKEQQKIADLLTSLDEVIREQAQKIDELKIHKKGLMQGLFPSLN